MHIKSHFHFAGYEAKNWVSSLKAVEEFCTQEEKQKEIKGHCLKMGKENGM